MSVEVIVANDRLSRSTEFLDGARVHRLPTLGVVASLPICPTLPFNLLARSESIVHIHTPNPWAAQAYLMSGHKGKLVITHHSDTMGRPFLRNVCEPFVRAAMRRSTAIIVTSQRYLNSSPELIEFREKCHVIPLGIDLAYFDRKIDEDAQKEIRARLGSRMLLAVGRLVPFKGFDYLVRAMQKIDATLAIIGQGPHRLALEKLILECAVSDKVHLLGPKLHNPGHVDDILPYYQAAKMLVFPSVSRAESFGIVQLEAMAAGIPVVNTMIDSGVPEVSLDGQTGITVPPADEEALAQAINFILQNDEQRLFWGKSAASRVRERFSVERMAELTSEVYETALSA